MISAAVRGVIQTVLGVWLFHDIVTGCVAVIAPTLGLFLVRHRTRLSSISIVLFGSICYTWLKDREMRQAALAQKQHVPIPMASTAVVDVDDDELNEADALIRETERDEAARDAAALRDKA
jgi:GDP-fucose transporter C1